MATTKTPNYTAEQTAEVVARFQAGDTVEAIAESFGKSVRSIVAKLSREGVYVAKAKATGAARVKKEALVAQIANLANVSEADLDSLEKATAGALTLVLEALIAQK